jgi:MoxR-like ATPase
LQSLLQDIKDRLAFAQSCPYPKDQQRREIILKHWQAEMVDIQRRIDAAEKENTR